MGLNGGKGEDRGTYLLFSLFISVSRCIILGNSIASDGSAFFGQAICTHIACSSTVTGQGVGRQTMRRVGLEFCKRRTGINVCF